MFRAKQLSSLLTRFPTRCLSARFQVENNNVILSKTLVSNRFYSSKDDGLKKKIPSIQECHDTGNMMSELPQPQPSFDEHNRNARNTYKKTLLFAVLFTAFTCAVAYKVIYTTNVPKDSGKKSPTPKKVSNKEEKKKVAAPVPVKIPRSSKDIPKEVPYLLIGGGTASFSAFRAIKSADPTARVLVVSKEEYYPYMRPPLSKEIWFNEDKDAVKKLIFKQWNGSERSLFYEPDDFYIDCKELMSAPNGGVAVARGWNITHLDVLEKKAYLDDGTAIQYKKALVATGAKTKKMPIFEIAAMQDEVIAQRVKYYRDIKDFEEVDKTFAKSKSIAIIGGGFLGSELACALARRDQKRGKEIVQIFRESGNMGKVLPEYLSFWTTEKVSAEGVTVKTNSEIINVKSENGRVVLNLNNGSSVTVDNVIVAIGVEPNTDFAKDSALEVDPDFGGYLVNSELQARTDLYIAGDCSCFYDPLLGRRRIEHHDHAVVSGRLAGENMTGAAKPYAHQSMFWSDLGPDVGYEAVGIVDSSLPTVGVFAKATYKDNPQAAVTQSGEGDRSKSEEIPKECMKLLTEKEAADLREIRRTDSKPNLKEGEDFGKGVIFYLKDDIVVGIVLWNIFNRMSIARQVLKAQNKYDDLNEVAKLFNIHEE